MSMLQPISSVQLRYEMPSSSTTTTTNHDDPGTITTTAIEKSYDTLTFQGIGRAKVGTSYVIPELKMMFDCGISIVNWVPRIICITHTHPDHIHSLPHYNHPISTSTTTTTNHQKHKKHGSTNLNHQNDITVYLPQNAVPFMKRYLQSYDELITMKYPYDSLYTDRKLEEDEKECMNNNNNNNMSNEGTIKNQMDPVRHNNLLLMGVVVPTDNDDENDQNDQNNNCTEGNRNIHEKIESHHDETDTVRRRRQQQQQYIPLPMIISTTNTRDQYYMEIIQCHHRIECIGYSIYRKIYKLQKQYQSLSKQEIRQLMIQYKNIQQQSQQQDGIDFGISIGQNHEQDLESSSTKNDKHNHVSSSMYDEYILPILLFLGDTKISIFQSYPYLLQQHKYVVIECTYLLQSSSDLEKKEQEEETHLRNKKEEDKKKWNTKICKENERVIRNANEYEHIYDEQLNTYIITNPLTIFLLTHFSVMYDSLYIRRYFNQKMKDLGTKNIHPMLVESEVQSLYEKEQQQRQQHDNENNNNYQDYPTCQCILCRNE